MSLKGSLGRDTRTFPYPKDAPSRCTSATVKRYLEDYVAHFDLARRLRLGTRVRHVRRDEDQGKWEICLEGGICTSVL